MNDLITVDNKEISIWESEQDLAQIKEIYGKDLSAGEFKTLVQMGKATGLSPFLKEIWAVKYGNNPAQIFIGRDGHRKSAQRSHFYDYHIADAVYSSDEFYVVDGEVKHKYSLINRGNLIGGYCIVKRKGSSRASYVFVEISEYNKHQSVWKEKPATMIKKVAEAQALRSAFQELFSGTYSEYEEWDHRPIIETKPVGKGVNGLKEKLGLIEKKDEPIEAEFNEITGEVEKENEIPFVTPDDVREAIESSQTLEELLRVRNIAKLLTDEEKKEMHILYRKKEKELSA